MKFDRTTFFTYVRRAPFGGRLTQEQVDGMSDMLDFVEANPSLLTDIREVAYSFASAYHETGGRMVPVRETFAISDGQAISRLNHAYKNGKLPQVKKPYWLEGWFGRGRIQVTHKSNYEMVERETGLPVTRNPTLLLDSKTDCRVIFPGNHFGWWTSGLHTLPKYFNETTEDPVNARRVVNGTDKAKHIAENIYKPFLGAFNAALVDTPLPVDVTVGEAKPDGKEWWQSTTIVSAIGSVISAGGASLIAAINNPFSLIFLLAALGFGFWIVRERLRHKYEKGV